MRHDTTRSPNYVAMTAMVVLLLLCAATPAAAEPAWGKSCLSCHDSLLTGRLFVYGEDTLADPDENATGAPDRGTLPVFQVQRGGSRTLQVQVSGFQTDDAYAVQLTRLRFPGVTKGGPLVYTGDCAWPEWGEYANYYSNPVVSYDWGTGPDTFDFTITAENASAGDYYDVVFAVVGKAAADGALFYAEEHFYVQVLNTVGDVNCDGAINNFDVDAFVMAMTEPQDYAATYPYCDRMLADIDQNGTINSFDIDPFVALLTAKKAAPAI